MKTHKEITAIILAAGRSSRMGAFKPLLRLGGSTFIEEAISGFIRAGVSDVRVVVGYRHEEVIPLLDRLGVKWLLNEDHQSGMLSSVLAAVRDLDPGVKAFFLLPVDIPVVKPRTIEALLKARLENDSPVIYPRFMGVRGHPPLIALSSITEALGPDYEGGLRAFLKRYEDEALDVDVADEGILTDCDTPEDLARIRKLHAREGIPTQRECRAICKLRGTPDQVVAHSRVVAEVARLLAVHLNLKGFRLDTDLIVAAGTLHDLARGRPNHASEGAAVLNELGYSQVAEAVARHMDIRLKQNGLQEADLVYLADKCVKGNRVVPLEERFRRSMEKAEGNPAALGAVEERHAHARIIRDRIERVLGQSLESVFERYGRGIRAAGACEEKAIYLVRHGSLQREGEGKFFVGQLDLPLDAEGIRQAEALRDRLKDVPFSAVYCSDLKRSLATAVIVAEAHGLEPQPLTSLREIHLGDWEGRGFEEIQGCFPNAFEERGRDIIDFRTPGGESFLDCMQRVIPAFFEIFHSAHGTVLIVGHAGVNRIILCQALGCSAAELLSIRQDYGCLNLISCEDSALRAEIINGRAV